MKNGLLVIVLISCMNGFAQTLPSEKDISYYNQGWVSINSTFRLSSHWGLVGDFHVRKDNYFDDDYFYFLRTGVVYWIAEKYPVTVGVAHTWLAPKQGGITWSDENRIYQQWSVLVKQNYVSVLHRIRLEERWRDVVVADEVVSEQFSVRLRYLASFETKVFPSKPKLPSLVLSDEVLVQFGEQVVYNTFDQNRLFIGLKVPMGSKWSCDVGYMNILQQKATGYQYDVSHVFRLFFYFNIDLASKATSANEHQENSE
jgi:hypothetical protein